MIRLDVLRLLEEQGKTKYWPKGCPLFCGPRESNHPNATGCVLQRIVYPQKGALTHHWKTSSVVRSLQLTSCNLRLVYSSSWTIAVFTCVALTGIFCIKTTQHIITLITATLNSWIGTVTWTIFSLIARHQNNSSNIYNHIHTSFLTECTNTLYNALVYM